MEAVEAEDLVEVLASAEEVEALALVALAVQADQVAEVIEVVEEVDLHHSGEVVDEVMVAADGAFSKMQ